MAVVVPSAAPARRAGSAARTAADLYFRRHAAAVAWRRDHAADADPAERDRLWRCFRTGALWTVRELDDRIRRALRQSLDAAERDVPFTPAGDPAP